MEKIKKLLLSSICFLSVLSFSACSNKIVINNAFVYLVHDSCFNYGSIQGEQWQSVYVNEYSKDVVATPKVGYKFVKWSDGSLDAKRKDLATNKNDSGPVIYYAYFEVDNG